MGKTNRYQMRNGEIRSVKRQAKKALMRKFGITGKALRKREKQLRIMNRIMEGYNG